MTRANLVKTAWDIPETELDAQLIFVRTAIADGKKPEQCVPQLWEGELLSCF